MAPTVQHVRPNRPDSKKGNGAAFPSHRVDGARSLLGPRLQRRYRHEGAAAAARAEAHLALGQCEQGVVAAHADVAARMPLGAALADDDVARHDVLAAELLHTEPLARGIASIA